MARLGQILLIGLAIWSVPVQADIQTFSTFMPTLSANNLMFQEDGANDGGSLYTVSSLGLGSFAGPGQAAGTFTILQPSANERISIPVAFVMAANTGAMSEDLVPGRFFAQPGIEGYFEFRYLGTAPLVFNDFSLSTGQLILRGDFANATLTGPQNGSAGGLTGSTLDDWDSIISYSSDIMDFTGSEVRDFSMSLTSITPVLKTDDGSLRSFSAEIGGSFSSDAAHISVSAAPEPATWAMMLSGFGLIGAVMRRRSQKLSAVARSQFLL